MACHRDYGLRPIGGLFHDVFYGKYHHCSTTVSYDCFFIGRLHRFIGNDMQRHQMGDGVWFQEGFFHRTVYKIQDGISCRHLYIESLV